MCACSQPGLHSQGIRATRLLLKATAVQRSAAKDNRPLEQSCFLREWKQKPRSVVNGQFTQKLNFNNPPSQAIRSMFNPILAKPGENDPLWITAEGETTRKIQPPAEGEALDATRISVFPHHPQYTAGWVAAGVRGGHGSPVLCWAL